MIVYGKQIFLYILDKYPHMVEEIYLSKELEKRLFSKIAKLNKPIIKLDGKKAQALARGGNHQGFLMKIQTFNFTSLSALKKDNFLLVLYGITDVGNIGAIIRSAYALGVDGVIFSGIKSVALEAIVRTSSGAVFDMPIVLFPDTLTLLNELHQAGFQRYAATMDGKDIRDIDFAQKRVLVMGSEGEGLSAKVIKKCDQRVTIKMQREFDSLNVSVATAILCDRMRKDG